MKDLPSNQQGYENHFGYICVHLRKIIELTQSQLGQLLGVSGRTIQRWECGTHSPTDKHLKRLLELCVQYRIFTSGYEYQEAEYLWLAARPKIAFDTCWLQTLLGEQQSPLADMSFQSHVVSSPAEPAQVVEDVCFDWGDALDVRNFYGRETECVLLERWVIQQRCRVVSVQGMGGIGKSALAITFMHQVASAFQIVVFRSVRNAPLCHDLITDCLQVFSPQPLSPIPESVDRCLDLLLECFQARRCLLVLDNFETVLQMCQQEGHYLPEYEDYAVLLGRVAEATHQSCLLLTGRETPVVLAQMEDNSSRSPVHLLSLSGLQREACERLLDEREIAGTVRERERLIDLYAGNPLALKMIAETIVDLFGGEVGIFLEQGEVIFSGVRDLLYTQYERLSPLEQSLLNWLAIVREPLDWIDLQALLVVPCTDAQVRETLDALQRRSLIEQGMQSQTYTLQSVVMEYVTEALVDRLCQQIQYEELGYLTSHALEQGSVKEYVRQTQKRFIVAPITSRLLIVYRQRDVVEKKLLSLLDRFRQCSEAAQGYGPANLIALLHDLRGHLRGLDLSRLVIRDASFRGVEMQDTSLAGTLLCETLFTEAFDASWAVAISNNGHYWAAGSRRGEVHVWEAGGSTLHRVWQAHTDNIYALVISPDERTLATGSWDGTLKLWDLETGDLRWTRWHANSINCLAFAPEGHLLASGGDDAVVHLWEVETGRHVQTLTGHRGAIYAVAWSPNQPLLASGGFDGSIRFWQRPDTPTVTCSTLFTGHTNWVHSLAWSPDGKVLTSGSWDQTVKLWDVASCSLLQTLTGHTDRVRGVVWSPDGRVLASASHDRTIQLWDVARRQLQGVFTGHGAAVHTLAFTPDSRSLLSGGDDGTLRVWDVTSGQCLRILEGYAVSLYDVAWSPNGQELASAGTDTMVTLWDEDVSQAPRVFSGHRWIVGGVVWSPDGQYLASSGWDNAIRIWQPSSGACQRLLRDPDAVDTIFQGIAWSPNGDLLASGSYMQGVQVWDMHTYTRRWVTHLFQTKIRCVEWSPDSQELASGGDDGEICLWDARDGALRETLWGHHGGTMCLAWSADGRWLASGGDSRGGGEVVVWDMLRREMVQAWREVRTQVRAVRWRSDGAILISGESDGTICWWDVSRGECVCTRRGHRGAIQALKISPDGRLLASCGDDGAIRLWDVCSGELQRTLRQDRPYERLNISSVEGLTEAQKITLRTLGAVEDDSVLP